MRTLLLVTVVALLGMAHVPAEAAPVEIPVAAEGARPGPGGVASLDQAAAEARRRRGRDPRAAIVIALAPGTHRLAGPVRLGPEDGGSAEAPLVIRGPADGSARLVGSVRLDPVPIDPSLSARVPEAGRGQVRAYRLPQAARAPARIQAPIVLNGGPAPPAFEVFDAEGAMHPARWPAEGFAEVESGDGPAFTLAAVPRTLLRDEPDLWAEGYWRWGWLFEALPVVRSAPGGTGARLTLDRTPYEGIRPSAPVRLVHALAALDRPGTWWRDARSGILLAWPRGGEAVEVSVADALLAIDGAAHLRIESLRLAMARGDLVRVQGGRDVVIADSALSFAGGRGAVFAGTLDGGLRNCDVTATGAEAVLLSGGERRTLAPGGLYLRDSRLTGFARRQPTQAPAVTLDGVGAEVSGNVIRDSPAYAIHIRGNDHRISGNEIANLLAGATDTGAIYAGRDWTARGTVIAGNFLHDIRGDAGHEVKGVYLDDMASGFTVSGNLFLRVDQPVFIGGGRDNRIEGNVFVAASPAIHVDSRGQTWASDAVSDPQSELRAAFSAMPVASAPWRARYPGLASLLYDRPAVASGNVVTDNLVALGEPFRFTDGGSEAEQTLARNRGPAGPRPDLPALARSSVRPEDFAGLAEGTGLRLPTIPFARMRRERTAGAPFGR
ncbi:right-handed parallel beta-helix repeat-containing protein [Methylobacterium nonmethylotrophicum]|uniref:Right-handed parallel beta-helix repeat-containing protein n=1 Tax=Methylobacterium nonmethylotrophicum TaxID=1141884 RepID=A0A4Z0NJ08_9HYPH|nr:right-handed parallel beta-helix repeat-containing protein [Methylobacterium nonmethylotrophicum]TGD95673.1 right-handed parallel beta-helix repeat-containing protein [Methylobacterium nonmethylotrophicum]